MEEINLTEKLKQLEAEVENEIRLKNEATQKIWEEMTGMSGRTNASVSSINPLTAQESIPTPATPPASIQPEPLQAVTLEDLNAPVITKEDFSADEKWAMVLAGGGGKGSYQI